MAAWGSVALMVGVFLLNEAYSTPVEVRAEAVAVVVEQHGPAAYLPIAAAEQPVPAGGTGTPPLEQKEEAAAAKMNAVKAAADKAAATMQMMAIHLLSQEPAANASMMSDSFACTAEVTAIICDQDTYTKTVSGVCGNSQTKQ